MVPLWCIIGLVLAATAVSSLGAAFSVIGLSDLFAAASLSVMAMGASLEFGKFVLAAYLHQRWFHVNLILRTYLLFSIVVLSGITSMGIFGYLSNAYQSASVALETENLKLETLKGQQQRINDEIARINKNISEIPDSRISKKLAARKDAEPMINSLNAQATAIFDQISQANMGILIVKQKVGPLIYVSKMFNLDIDVVVKYLILVLVSVFDPLAICLVIASSEALNSRRQMASNVSASNSTSPQNSPAASSSAAGTPVEEVIQMRFTDDETPKAG